MPIQVILGALALASSIPLLWLSIGSEAPAGSLLPGQAAAADLHQITLQRSAVHRLLRPFVAWLAGGVRKLTPQGWVKSLERRAAFAGVADHKVERFLAAKVAAVGVGAAAIPFVLGAQDVPKAILMAGIATFAAFMAPDGILASMARKRQEEIELTLPDTLDQIMISVEAGLGFEAALARVGRTGSGPLAEEVLRALYEMQMGIQRRKALHDMASRSGVADLRNFVFAVTQSEQYGLPVADTLRVQAAELRDKRRQRAEERAIKIPVKITFPLVLCIFPSLFVVLLGPAALNVANGLL